MPTRTRTERTFASKLRSAIRDADVSVRGLARRLDPENTEIVRRRLNKYLAGQIVPRPETRAAIARALGLPEEHFEEDDEESDLLAALLNELERTLAAARAAYEAAVT